MGYKVFTSSPIPRTSYQCYYLTINFSVANAFPAFTVQT